VGGGVMIVGFNWKGDLEDDCSCASVDGFMAHAENMGYSPCEDCGHDNDGDSGTCEKCGTVLSCGWYCSVKAQNHHGEWKQIFHTTDDNVLPLTGKAARSLCEMVILAGLDSGLLWSSAWPWRL